jgi:two-component system chemotaxis response regulator CheB
MPRIRVLVVDDSVVVRRLVSDALSTEPMCEVVGAAANGRIAIAKIPQVNPDVVTLDIEMPEMDGLETLTEIRKKYPHLPVIMFSALTERAAAATLKALALGATDYVTKPSAANVAGALEHVRSELVAKILCFGNGRGRVTPPPVAATRPVERGVRAAPRATRVDVVAIGTSTGGPNALAAVLARLSASFPVPVVVTQHMPPLFTRLLAERLNASSALHVVEARGGEALEPGQVLVAPGDYHMGVRREGTAFRTVIHQAPPENSCRPAVDVMFRSVVEVYGAHTLALVMTGMGQDGLRGCELVREAGGQVVVQDEATSVVWGMPGYVARAGLADAVVALDDIHVEIESRANGSRGPQRLLAPSERKIANGH